MALAAKLQLRQSQSLVMTPQLMQSIRLLQLSHVELERFIDDEIEKNPLLERVSPEGDDPSADRSALAEREPENDWSANAIADRLDTTLENVFPDDSGARETVGPDLAAMWRSGGGTGGGFAEAHDFEDVSAAPFSLRDHIAEQIAFDFASPAEKLIAWNLADSLDEAGYMRGDLREIAALLAADLAQVEDVLARCQRFDPPGLFARDLAECLSLQLAARDRLDPAMQALLAHLDLLARRDFQALKRICGVDEEDLIDMRNEIRSLDPKPGAGFGSGHADTVVPDVTVRAAPDGSWAVELNGDVLPRVLVDQSYFATVSARSRDDGDRVFLADCMQSANWLTRSLDQRARTILKVTSEIVRQQDAFLAHGIVHLRPLNLRTVAEAIGMHESTVSRVTANKYMATPRGVFELRFFFNAALSAVRGGETHSSEAVRHKIRRLIDDESPAEVLSDDTIVDILRETGIDIARRTVAKYREAMNIASSVQRRREKRALEIAGR